MNRLFALLKVICIAMLLVLMLALLASLNPWSDFGLGSLFDSGKGKVGIGLFLVILGVAYWKTAFLHASGAAFEASGVAYGVGGLIFLAWGLTQLMGFDSGGLVFESWVGRMLFVAVFIVGPANVGAAVAKSGSPQEIAAGSSLAIGFAIWMLIFVIARNTGASAAELEMLVAARDGQLETIVQVLDEGADVNAMAKGVTMIDVATIEGHPDVVRLLLSRGASIDMAANEGNSTVLHTAAQYNRAEIAGVLIDAGADVSARDKFQMQPLHYAAQKGHFEVALALLDQQADLAAEDSKGWRPIHFAAASGSVEMLSEFLKRGADANVKAVNGTAPLHLAAYYGHLEVVRRLLRAGAQSDVAIKTGQTPLDMATTAKHPEVAALLKAHQSPDN